MFLWRNKKNIIWIPPLICSYDQSLHCFLRPICPLRECLFIKLVWKQYLWYFPFMFQLHIIFQYIVWRAWRGWGRRRRKFSVNVYIYKNGQWKESCNKKVNNLSLYHIYPLSYEPAHDKNYSKTCVTSKDSDQPVHPPSMARVLVYPSLGSLGALEGTCNQWRLILSFMYMSCLFV